MCVAFTASFDFDCERMFATYSALTESLCVNRPSVNSKGPFTQQSAVRRAYSDADMHVSARVNGP